MPIHGIITHLYSTLILGNSLTIEIVTFEYLNCPMSVLYILYIGMWSYCTAKPKKPSKEERIAEKKAKRRAEDKAPEVVSKPLTATEELEEKLTQQRLQEESDLAVAMETFSVKHKLIDTMEPKSEEEFAEFQEALTAKISKFEVSSVYLTTISSNIICVIYACVFVDLLPFIFVY